MRKTASNYLVHNPNVSIGDVEPMLLDVVQTLSRANTRFGLSRFSSTDLNETQGANLAGRFAPVASAVTPGTDRSTKI